MVALCWIIILKETFAADPHVNNSDIQYLEIKL